MIPIQTPQGPIFIPVPNTQVPGVPNNQGSAEDPIIIVVMLIVIVVICIYAYYKYHR